MSLTFTADDAPDDDVKRGRRPNRAVVTPPDHQTVTVLDPWRVVDDDGTTYMPGESATIPAALADEWIRNHWATKVGE
jgi:hypothetical protein